MRALILGCATIAVICDVRIEPDAVARENRRRVDDIEQAPFLTKDQKRDILYHNAVRFLRLEEDASGARPSQEE